VRLSVKEKSSTFKSQAKTKVEIKMDKGKI
jgi:hypothetical protein